jgi:hypothetical protein
VCTSVGLAKLDHARSFDYLPANEVCRCLARWRQLDRLEPTEAAWAMELERSLLDGHDALNEEAPPLATPNVAQELRRPSIKLITLEM